VRDRPTSKRLARVGLVALVCTHIANREPSLSGAGGARLYLCSTCDDWVAEQAPPAPIPRVNSGEVSGQEPLF